jgi:hypothetical protein
MRWQHRQDGALPFFDDTGPTKGKAWEGQGAGQDSVSPRERRMAREEEPPTTCTSPECRTHLELLAPSPAL